MAVRLLQKNGSEDVTSNDDARVNFALFGTCVFAGIGNELSCKFSQVGGSGWTATIGTGMGCFGGRLIQVSEPEILNLNEIPTAVTAVFIVVDLRFGQESTYFTTERPAGSTETDKFFEDGKIYVVPIQDKSGYSFITKRKPGEAEYCRKIAQTGKIGNTPLTDLFKFDENGKISDINKVHKTEYADTAGAIKVGKNNLKMKAGLEVEGIGSRLVTIIKVVDGITIAKTYGGDGPIDTDPKKQEFSIGEDVRKKLGKFDDIILVSLISSSNSSFIDGAGVAINGGSFLRDGLEMKITENGKLLVRWKKGAVVKDFSSATLRFIGTII